VPYVEVSKVINAPKGQLYEILKDMEKYPQFMKDLKSVKVLERHANTTLTEWETKIMGNKIKWVERDIFDDDNQHIRYHQHSGDLHKFEGEWILQEGENGTRVTLTVDFEIGVPMLAGLLNPVAKLMIKDNCSNMLNALKLKMEQ
jgi:ribosome-associated toxin RatA of RatAB toxin-antitoxin module